MRFDLQMFNANYSLQFAVISCCAIFMISPVRSDQELPEHFLTLRWQVAQAPKPERLPVPDPLPDSTPSKTQVPQIPSPQTGSSVLVPPTRPAEKESDLYQLQGPPSLDDPSFVRPSRKSNAGDQAHSQRPPEQLDRPAPDEIPSGAIEQSNPNVIRLDLNEATVIEERDAKTPKYLEPMWWEAQLKTSLGLSEHLLPITVDQIVTGALSHSVQLHSLRTEPEIARSEILIESAAFDWTAFVESQFDDTSDPIGNALTVGNVDAERFIDQTWTGAAGLRRRNCIGGQTEIAQHAGRQRNNSQFLIPNPQGTTRFELTYTQPLLQGGGRFVNESRIILARLDTSAIQQETRGRIQDHLIDVANAYWAIYSARSLFLQRQRLYRSAGQVHQALAARSNIDVLKRQLLRADAAVTSREAEVIRAATEIRNAQAELRRLTNDPNLVHAMGAEWTPIDVPLPYRVDVSAAASAQLALSNRPEVLEAMKLVRAASVEAKVAQQDLLPKLDLMLRSYVAGLKDDADAIGSWELQWTNGRPTWGAGLVYEFPLGNRAANGRLRRQRWELQRALFEMQSTIEQTLLEVDVSTREIHTTFQEMISKQSAVFAAEAEVQYLQQRWELLPGTEDSAVLLLENLLDAQERLATEEAAFTTSQVNYAKAWIALRRAMGTLLQVESVASPTPSNQLPAQQIIAPGGGVEITTEHPMQTEVFTDDDIVNEAPLVPDEPIVDEWIEPVPVQTGNYLPASPLRSFRGGN